MKIVVNPKYNNLNSFLNHLPDEFERSGISIYKGRNELKCFSIEGLEVVVKAFRKPHFVNQIVYSFFRKSKAFRSYENSIKILDRGFLCPEPIAYIEIKKYGLLSSSYYVSLYQKNREEIREYMANYKTEYIPLITEFAQFTAQLHKAGILHLDYSPGNILVSKPNNTYQFSLVDVNRIAFGNIPTDKVYDNFSRLCTSREVSTLFATQYAKFSEIKDPSFVDKVNKVSDDFFKRYAFRLGYKSWKKEGGSWFTQPLFKYNLYEVLSKTLLLSSETRRKYIQKQEELYKRTLKPFDFRGVIRSN